MLAMSHGFHPDTPVLLFLDGVLRDDASMPLCSITTPGPPAALAPLQRIATASKDACAYIERKPLGACLRILATPWPRGYV
jgi:hypothetical protein